MRAGNILSSAKWAKARCPIRSLPVGFAAGAMRVLTTSESERVALYLLLLVSEALPAAQIPLAVPVPVHTLAGRSGCRMAEGDR
jgi:hypothetical protein